MKLWKVILGIVAFIGGIFAVSASKKADKKEFDNKVKENEAETKKVQEAAAAAEAEKIDLKKKSLKLKRKQLQLKHKLKTLLVLKKLLKILKKSIVRSLDVPRKTHETITNNSIIRSI